ncbi:MAG: hypothetical protein SFU56_06840 [Capsulimonadales bacterium]|nr:hypothetical protein [Capsulimonadales bacterium]
MSADRATSGTLPDVRAAQSELGRRYLRAVLSLLIRIVALALLEAIVFAQFPGLSPLRWLADMVAGVLALWPFFLSVGRLYGHRIALGTRFSEAGRPAEAARLLAPVDGWRARFFDPTGEGLYRRGMALDEMGETSEAVRVLEQAAGTAGPWGEKARARLSERDGKRAEI